MKEGERLRCFNVELNATPLSKRTFVWAVRFGSRLAKTMEDELGLFISAYPDGEKSSGSEDEAGAV